MINKQREDRWTDEDERFYNFMQGRPTNRGQMSAVIVIMLVFLLLACIVLAFGLS